MDETTEALAVALLETNSRLNDIAEELRAETTRVKAALGTLAPEDLEAAKLVFRRNRDGRTDLNARRRAKRERKAASI